MWNKPKEISDYPGNGFEISYHSSDSSRMVSAAMEGWKSSSAHNLVVLNRGEWKNMKWKAMGIGVKDGYACVWFGTVADTEPMPGLCVP